MILNEDAIFSKTCKNPVYIVLMNGKSPLSSIILSATGDYFSHACIAFNDSLDPLYSFGSKSKTIQKGGMGFCVSKPTDLTVFNKQAYYAVYVTYVTDEAYAKMKERLSYFTKNANKMIYDYIGLLNVWMHQSSDHRTRAYFCSRFVMNVIGAGVKLDKLPSLYRPQDIANMDNITLVNRGYDFHNYDKKITQKNEKLLKKGKLNTDDIIFEDVSSVLQKDFQSKHDMNLSSFEKMRLSDAAIQVYGQKIPSLSHVRVNNNTKGYIWIDKRTDMPVAIVNVEEKDDGFSRIQAFEIFTPYKGHGLSKDILNVAIRDLKATNLSVNKDNQVAIKIYKSYGFKIYKTTENMYYMSIDKNAFDDEDDYEESALIESSSKYIYFLSNTNMDGKILYPRIPTNFMTKNGYEESKTPRVCFSISIDGSLMGLSRNLKGEELYVHIPIDKVDTYKPSINEVPDCDITGEIWVKDKVKIICIGKIKVLKDKGLPGHKYNYGNKTAELYDWEWKWEEKYNISESTVQEETLEIQGETGFYDRHNRWNPMVIINGENYRHRVECLIMCQNKLFVAESNDGNLLVPGGGVDKSLSDEEQVYNECKEEARILVKDIKPTGYSYIRRTGVSPSAKNLPKEQQWVGSYTEVYIANYMKDFTGFIDYCDKDSEMIRGRFRVLSDIDDRLLPEWKAALIDANYISVATESIKFFKSPKLALKRKVQSKKRSMTQIGNFSDTYQAAPTIQAHSVAIQHNSSEIEDSDIPDTIKENAKHLLENEILGYFYPFSLTECCSMIDCQCVNSDDYAILSFRKPQKYTEDHFNFVTKSIFEHCNKIFSDTNPGYILKFDKNCIYISRR